MIACYRGNWIYVCLSAFLLSAVEPGEFTLSMDRETSCTNAHYYQAGDVFHASANDSVHAGHCPLTFIQSGAEGTGYMEPCLSLCVRILGYSMESCEVNLAYHDGLNDFDPVTFDCRKFPPVLWCSSKTDLKVTVSELKNYNQDGKEYKISLEIKPFCGSLEQLTTDSSIVAQPQMKPSSMSKTVVIIGAIVGTISILFVLGWLIYCYRKRHADSSTSSHVPSSNRTDRNVRGSTPNQPTNRYAPIERKPPSSQSSSDRGMNSQYPPNPDQNLSNIPNMTERRLYSPFQPPQTNRNQYAGQGPIQQQVLYSDIDRGPQPGDKWYPMTALEPSNSNMNPVSTPSNQMSQYMMQNQVYKYPADGEMHTAPTDTRYVVYDFDFETKPMERKYSAGKAFNTQYRESPIKDIDRSRPRETTPLRESVKVMPSIVAGPLDSTTDHTSDNDSSVSGTTEDETTTDDQMHPGMYNFVPGYNYNKSHTGRLNSSNTRLYDPRNFQRIENPVAGNQSDDFQVSGQNSASFSGRNNSQVFKSSPDQDITAQSNLDEQDMCKEGPMPQVPPMPKDFKRAQRLSPGREPPWPHGPPPPYSEVNKFHV